MGLDGTAKNFRSVSNIRANNFLKTKNFNQCLGRQNIIQFMHSIEINIRICHPESDVNTAFKD